MVVHDRTAKVTSQEEQSLKDKCAALEKQISSLQRELTRARNKIKQRSRQPDHAWWCRVITEGGICNCSVRGRRGY